MARERESVWVSDTRGNGKGNPLERDTRVNCERNKVGTEGWIPVVRNHRRQISLKERIIYTLFVDNIPDQKDTLWLKKTFNNFGEVIDVFIPRKRSKRYGKKFGFVRFQSQGVAAMAMRKMNGVWVENEKLFVKEAYFGQNMETRGKKYANTPTQYDRGKGVMQNQGAVEIREKHNDRGRTYAEILRGETLKGGDEHHLKLFVKPVGNGWLERSAVARLNRVVPLSTLQVSFSMNTNRVAHFRSMGGRAVLITFQNSEVRDEMINEPWMKLWFENVKPWTGEPACLERFVWLSCKGVPLSAWNISTFKRIAECWGSYILVDDQTLRDGSFAEGKVLIVTEELHRIDKWINIRVGALSYDVKIMELSSVNSPDEVEIIQLMSKIPAQSPAPNKGVGEEEDDVDADKEGPANKKRGVGKRWDLPFGESADGDRNMGSASILLN